MCIHTTTTITCSVHWNKTYLHSSSAIQSLSVTVFFFWYCNIVKLSFLASNWQGEEGPDHQFNPVVLHRNNFVAWFWSACVCTAMNSIGSAVTLRLILFPIITSAWEFNPRHFYLNLWTCYSLTFIYYFNQTQTTCWFHSSGSTIPAKNKNTWRIN